MRIRVPVPLIREMDAVITEGIGGYATRAEFILDAVQERILELTAEGVEDAGPPPGFDDVVPDLSEEQAVPAARRPSTRGSEPPPTLCATVLLPPEVGFGISAGDDLSRPSGHALFGLHNRDYPSLWALNRLAAVAGEEPVLLEGYLQAVLGEAWAHGELLLAIEKDTGLKCTALFPTNSDKRQSAESRFRSFAVGEYRAGSNNIVDTGGPLFEWRAVGLCGSVHEPRIGLTDAGWQLLSSLSGLSVEEPHAPSLATAFLAYLEEHAPADKRGFVEVLRAIGIDGATRREVLDRAREQWPEWNDNEVSTNAAAYVARSREWGLVEPKQVKSRYHLTPLGLKHLKEDGSDR